jgi:hypothetical protein
MANAVSEFIFWYCGDLINHESGKSIETVPFVRRNRNAKQRRLSWIGCHDADRDGFGGIKAVILYNDRRPRLTGVILSRGDRPYFSTFQSVASLRQAVQKQVPQTEPENEVVFSTEQDFRQALLDRGVHPTLLPPPPRDFNESPPISGNLKMPKPPRGWQWLLVRTDESAGVDNERSDDIDQEDQVSAEENETGTNPRAHLIRQRQKITDPTRRKIAARKIIVLPSKKFMVRLGTRSLDGGEYNPYGKSWFAHPK